MENTIKNGLLNFWEGGRKPRAFVSGLLGGDTTELKNALASISQLGNPEYMRNIKPMTKQQAIDVALNINPMMAGIVSTG